MSARTYAAEVARILRANGFRVRRFRKGERARIEVRIDSGGKVWTLGRMYLAPHAATAPPSVEAHRIIGEYTRARARASCA